jgi:hypothetical protein
LARPAGADLVAPTWWLTRTAGSDTSHPAGRKKIDVVFFSANFCRYRRAKSASLLMPENLYRVFRGTT